MLSITDQHWLFASGDADRLEVLRSPVVRGDDPMHEPVRRFIAQHGLVLSAQENFEHEHFVWGGVEASVYVTPAARYAGGVELLPSMDGFAGTTPEVLTGTALEHVNDHWPFTQEAPRV